MRKRLIKKAQTTAAVALTAAVAVLLLGAGVLLAVRGVQQGNGGLPAQGAAESATTNADRQASSNGASAFANANANASTDTGASANAASAASTAQSVPLQEPAAMKAYNLPDGFVYVDDIIPDAVLEIRYATAHNFIGVPIDGYEQPLAILSTQAATALQSAAARAAADGWRMRIYDAYRPQQALDCITAWEASPDTTGKAEFYPNMEKAALFTDGYLSKYSRHTRGSTVDLTLQNVNTGALIDMGGTYDLLDPLSNYGAAGLTAQQHENRAYLRAIMDEAGFDSIATEWWHFQLRAEPYPKTYFDFPVA